MEKVFIYTLEHPITGEIRYVGKTKNPKMRFHNHCNKLHNERTHKRNWINSLRSQNLRPIMRILDEVSVNEWHYWERYWITQFKQWGFNLINHTSGGDGLTLGNQTSFKKGQLAWNKGITHTSETKERLRQLVLGKPSKKLVKVKRYSMDGVLLQIHESATEAALFVNGCNSHIISCCKGKRNSHKNYKWSYE